MTKSIAAELKTRRADRRRRRRTMAGDLCGDAMVVYEGLSSPSWPATQYQNAPVDFARDVLGEKPWAKQVEILEAARDYKRLSVRSGHKVGKSRTAAMLALWFFASFPDARVVMSSTTSRQVDRILWRELRMMYARCPVKLGPVEDIHELARSGLQASDFREVVGFTAREAEAVAGISGPNLLYLLDEASGIPDPIFEAIEGNRAGGARVAMFSNPTKTDGEFFESFHGKSDFYHCIHVSSVEAAAARMNGKPIPGLATVEWLEEKKLEWGEDSPLYKVRALGEFVYNESGRVISIDAIGQAEARWEDTEAEGRLVLGLDPAGPGLAGDESAAAPRRGRKVIDLRTWRGLKEEDLVREALDYLDAHRHPSDTLMPLVNVDSDGMIGSKVLGLLRAQSEIRKNFEVVGVKTSTKLPASQKFPHLRDRLWWNFAQWIRSEEAGGVGGAIPTNTKLAKELHSPSWEDAGGDRVKVTHKDELRVALGRSPDRADAVVLSVWTPAQFVAEDQGAAAPSKPERRAQFEAQITGVPQLDPYAALDAWNDGRRRR